MGRRLAESAVEPPALGEPELGSATSVVAVPQGAANDGKDAPKSKQKKEKTTGVKPARCASAAASRAADPIAPPPAALALAARR